jgi:hypothetical protein
LAFIELENFGIVSEVKDEKLSVRQVYRHFCRLYLVPVPFFQKSVRCFGSGSDSSWDRWISIPNHDQKREKLTLKILF